jgi:biopolymer transport protein ExbD
MLMRSSGGARARLAPAAVLTSLAVLLGACDETPAAKPTSASSSAAATAPAAAAPSNAPKPKTMPELLVDPDGPFLGGRRVDLAAQGGREKLAQVIKELPIDGKPVTLTVEKKAKTSYVAAVVTELGNAGAPKVTIKTDGRDDLPKEVAVTPESRVGSPPACSVVAIVRKELSTAVWPVKGGTAKNQRKGFAGPDLTLTGEVLGKELEHCDSTMAFFSGDDSVPWETAFNLAGTVVRADAKKRVDTLVLLHEVPVAGRAVAIGK